MGPALDDATLRYALAARPVFETFRRVLTQLAGFALLKAVGVRDANMQDTPLVLACEALAPALEGLGALRPTPRAAHHHRHLRLVAEALEQALAHSEANLISARADALPEVSQPFLDAAVDNLRSVARLLPGFEVVSLDQACCACHPAEIHRAQGA